MNEQEAILRIKGYGNGCETVALEMAIKALDKQIPKKPTYNGTYQCPNCGCSQDREPRGGTVNGVHHDYVYCWYCGTAIDWSNSNE